MEMKKQNRGLELVVKDRHGFRCFVHISVILLKVHIIVHF